jgi:hypothetical protein
MTGHRDRQEHGLSAYQYGRCRCADCTEMHRKAQYRSFLGRKARLKADPSIRPHGDATTYQNWGCRCEPCRRAGSEVNRKYRRPYVPGYVNPNGRRLYGPRGPVARVEPFGREWLNGDDEPEPA